MALQYRLGIIITFLAFGINAQPQNLSWARFFNKEVAGIWQLIEVKENNIVIEDEKYKECSLREELRIRPHRLEVFKITEYEIQGYINMRKIDSLEYFPSSIEGYIIGKTDSLVCFPNPETFEFEIGVNACYDTIIQDVEKKKTWYQFGEGVLIEYYVCLTNGYLILEEKFNNLNSNHRRLTFEKKRN